MPNVGVIGGEAHESWQYTKAGQVSRMQEDLHNSLYHGEQAARLSANTMIRRLLPAGRMPHVCVVGAGMAGLRCADVLTKRDVKVTLLEARDRIGGRVHQSKLHGRLVDLGANWIHGTDNNPILHLAKETDTTTLNPEEDSLSRAVDQSGHVMEAEKSKECNEAMWGIIDDAFEYSREESISIAQDRSLLDFFQAKLIERKLNPATTKLILQMVRIWGDFIGDPIEKQSLKYLWLEQSIDGDNLFVASTYKAILDRIAEPALRNADLHLSTKVTQVYSNPKLSHDHSLPIAVSTNRQDAPFLYDEIVVTAPLGYLKRNLSTFSPSLPDHLSKAISQTSYGRLEKVYVTFSTAYWSQSSLHEKGNAFFTHFLHPTYASKQNPKGWNMDCASLAELPGSTAQPTLLFYMHGECAEHIISLINGLEPDSPEYYNRLQPFFEPYYSRLPNYSALSKFCTPVGFLATNWQNDEYAGFGSYTNFQISHKDNAILLDENIKIMRNGAPERNIWLAGEHTAPFVALGTVTGAYLAGDSVAKRILSAYGIADEEERQDMAEVNEDQVYGEESRKADNEEAPVDGTSHGAGVVGL